MSQCTECGDLFLRLPVKVGKKKYCQPCWEMKTVREEIAETDKKGKDHNGRAPLPFVL